MQTQLKLNLLEKVESKKANLVILGMGYVGIPLAASFARTGFKVTGFDINKAKIDSLNAGIYPIQGDEPGMPELVAEVVAENQLSATANPRCLKDADVIFVVVDTPLIGTCDRKRPNITNLENACQEIGKRLNSGSMVIIESTLAPLTMEKTVQPILEECSGLKAGEDFALAHCPERVMPGRLLYNLKHYDRVIGGINKESCEIAENLYKHIVDGKLVGTSMVHAELTKTGENAYRDMEIAFANMLALLCEDVGANVYEVRELINMSPFRNVHMPGAGVGGHCITKDAILMVANSERFRDTDGFHLVHTCRDLNDWMPNHVNELFEEAIQELHHLPEFGNWDFKVAILGYSYLPESDDDRNSPTESLLGVLNAATAVRVHDPYVPKYKDLSWQNTVEGADAVIVMVAHNEYKEVSLQELKNLMRGNIIIDGRNVIDKHIARKHGFIYKGIGNTV